MKGQSFVTYTSVLVVNLFLCISCIDNNSVKFETPQPENKEDEKSIPNKLLGKYRSLKDSSILVITSHDAISFLETVYSEPLSKLDSSERSAFKNDTTMRDSNIIINVIVKGDSMFQHWIQTDTLLDFSNKDVLRKFKGYYFINRKIQTNEWSVTKVGITKDGLILGTISSQEDIKALRELTGTESDTVYNFRPSKKTLKRFIKDKGFKTEERFVRIEE